MNVYKLFFSVLLISVLTASCNKVESNDLKDDVPFHQSYWVEYNSSTGSTSASAVFRTRKADGALIELTGEASVTANGKVLKLDPISKSLYIWSATEIFDVHFNLKKAGGNNFSNTVKTSDAYDLKFKSDQGRSIKKSDGITIDLPGPDKISAETFELTVRGADINNPSAQTNLNKTLSEKKIILTPEELTIFKEGKIKMTLERIRNMSLTSPDQEAGGNMEVKYISEMEFDLE